MNRLRVLWHDLWSSLWLLPGIIVAGAVIAALGLVEVDSLIDRSALSRTWPRVFGAGAEGSRAILGAIASSMITVAGVTFSITVVALTLASTQYTSRVLGNFMRDRTNQTVLGVFVGVFAYCLVVLRTIRGPDEHAEAFVPALSVLGALVLAFAAIAYLIYFIHHVATSIQATSILRAAADETLRAVDRLYPEAVGEPAPACTTALEPQPSSWATVPASVSGYVQSIDEQVLFEVARRCEGVVRIERTVGDFVVEDCPLVRVSGRAPDEALVAAVNAAYVIGRDRTIHQDAAFGIRQIVDVALKALSPGVNDTTTAVNAIDYLGAILCRLASRQIPPPVRGPVGQGEPRILARGPTFDRLLGEAVDQIRQNAEGNVGVLLRLVTMLATVATRTRRPERRLSVRREIELVLETGARSIPLAHDRAVLEEAARDGFASIG